MIWGVSAGKRQGTVDWKAIQRSGAAFAFLRTGYGWKDPERQRDERFLENFSGSGAVGLKMGAYHRSQAMTPSEAEQEAAFCRAVLARKTLDYPVFLQLDSPEQKAIGREALTALALAFLGRMEGAGYVGGIAAPRSWLENRFDLSVLDGVPRLMLLRRGDPRPTGDNVFGIYQRRESIGSLPEIIQMDGNFVQSP